MEFAQEHDVPIPSLQRTRGYHRALGIETPYRWAHDDQVPFMRTVRPSCRLIPPRVIRR